MLKMLYNAISLNYAIFVLKTFNTENSIFQLRGYYYVKTSLASLASLDSSTAKLLKSHFGTKWKHVE